jgi:hypothetical protein
MLTVAEDIEVPLVSITRISESEKPLVETVVPEAITQFTVMNAPVPKPFVVTLAIDIWGAVAEEVKLALL